jgi:hypothetical protein
MKKLSIITLAVSIAATFNTNSFFRPTVLLLQALNKSHQTIEETPNNETGISTKTITPAPFIDYTYTYHKNPNYGNLKAEIKTAPISRANTNYDNFNKAQLAFYAVTTSSIYMTGKGLAQLTRLPKTSIGKSIRNNGCCFLSLIIMEKYKDIRENYYNTVEDQIEDFMKQQYEKFEDFRNKSKDSTNDPSEQ